MSPRDPTPGSVHFRVMSYNVEQGNLSNDTLEAIGLPHAEVVCLQEVSANWRSMIEARWKAEYPNMVFATNESDGGLAVLSKWPIEDDGIVAFPGDQSQWHPGLVVRVTTPGGPIQVIDLHLRAIFEGSSNPISNYLDRGGDHVMEINTFLDHTIGSEPVVMAGDFNEGPTGAAVTALGDRGFLNALPAFHPGQFTWHGKGVGGELDLTEDYVLFDKGFDTLDSWVMRIGGSDHLPVLGHVQLRQGPPSAEYVAPVATAL